MNYPLGAIEDPSAPWNENLDHLFECDACHAILNKYEDCDPCIIEGRTLCDKCASNLTLLRIDGVLNEVSERTGRLRHEHDKEVYYKVYDKVNFPQG